MRRWEMNVVLVICGLLLYGGCRSKLPAEFSRMGGVERSNPPAAPGGGLDAGAPLDGEQDALAGPESGLEGEGGVVQEPVAPAPGEYAADTLYAIPQQTSVAVGEAVRIVVATGVPANSFHYMNGVRVTFGAGEPNYVPGSYNVGAIGGAADFPDGIWALVGPGAFLLPTDYMLSFNNYDSASNSWAMDFNVTPIGGQEVNDAEGELFNFEVTFAQAGTVHLGFSQFKDVKRTYYSDSRSQEYSWSSIGNNNAGVANTIEVTN